jgi:iron complex outermembrane receptor protein
VEVGQNVSLTINMNRSVVEHTNVTVTSFLRAASSKRTPTPINTIRKEDLFNSAATNFIDALSKTPGVTQLSTGPAISKPVIRGLGYNRVVVINDGVRQEGQQWGDEHGVEIDEYGVNRTEVLKVPASIIYGSEALSGVIYVTSNVPVAEGAIRGNLFSNYQSNNHLQGYHFDLAGNENGVVWGFNGSSKRAGDYENRYDGKVYNSRFNELNGSAYLGVEKDWGYSHFFVSRFHQQLGIIDGSRDALGRFTQPVMVPILNGMGAPTPWIFDETVSSKELNSFTPSIPYQEITHTKYVWDNSIKWGEGRLKANVAFQRNERKEFGDLIHPRETNLYFDLGTTTYSFQYLLPDHNNWKHTIGVAGMTQTNTNRGEEQLIPNYTAVDLGLFFFTQKNLNRWHLSGGARIDQKGIKYDFNNATTQNEYGDVAGSFGATYDIDDNFVLKFNIAKGYRAPNLAELASHGAHEGTNRYEYGNPFLRSEKSLQEDLGMEWSDRHVSISANVFYNTVTDYIYYEKISNHLGKDSILNREGQNFYAFRFAQGNAHLYGVETNIDLHPHPLDGLHVENTISYVKGRFDQAVDGSYNLPGIPPLRWLSELRYELQRKAKSTSSLKNTFFAIQMDNVSSQENAFVGYNTETTTPGYTLFNASMGTQITNSKGRQICAISINAQNITDVAYQNHLSRLKYLDENPLTGRMGVYNMGRNFSLKVNVPLMFD